MSEDKRVKKFTNIDEVLLHPGEVVSYVNKLREQIYYQSKKLRRQNNNVKVLRNQTKEE